MIVDDIEVLVENQITDIDILIEPNAFDIDIIIEPVGLPGPKGEKGDPGSISGTFEFIQGTPSAVWSINHGLNYHPSVTVVDSSGNVFIGDVKYVDQNSLIITFSAAFSGNAYLS